MLIFTNSYPQETSGESIFCRLDKNIFTSAKFVPILIKDSRFFYHHKVAHLILFVKFWRVAKQMLLKVRPNKVRSDLGSILRVLFYYKSLRETDERVYFTFWLSEVTLALTFLKEIRPDILLITRLHGVDYIKERHKYPVFHQLFNYTRVDKAISQSNWGRSYCKRTYLFNDTVVAPLGIPDKGVVKKMRHYSIAICSNLIPIKRVDSSLKLLLALSEELEKEINVVVLGEGPLREQLESIQGRFLNVNFLGAVPNQNIIDIYKKFQVSTFFHLSQTEGGVPLAVQEALSAGLSLVISQNDSLMDLVDETKAIITLSEQQIRDIRIKELKQFFLRYHEDIKAHSLLNRALYLRKYEFNTCRSLAIDLYGKTINNH